MLVPALAVAPMVLGGVVQWIWAKAHPRTEDVYNIPLSSGFIVGEALVALFMAIVAMASQ